MKKISDKIINQAAFICIKYDIGDEIFFYKKFRKLNSTKLKNIWDFNFYENKSKVIKDTPDISVFEIEEADRLLNNYKNDFDYSYKFLLNDPEWHKLSFREISIQRRLRNKLGKWYIEESRRRLIYMRYKLIIDFYEKLKNILLVKRKWVYILLVSVILIGPRLIEGFTSVEKLTVKIHEKSKYKFNGSVCRDGTISRSQGRGSCSWHGGVSYKFHQGDYAKSEKECYLEAKKKSWVD